MFLGELPDLRETRSGKDLIAIGVKEGKLEGERKAKLEDLIRILEVKFGSVTDDVRTKIQEVESVEVVNKLIDQAVLISSIQELDL